MKMNLSCRFFLLLCLIIDIRVITAQIPELVLPIGHSGRVRDAGYSPAGKKISTTSEDRTVKIWNAENGRLLLTLDGFNSFEIVSTVTFSPGGKSIMTVNEVGIIRIWDSNSGKLLLKPDYGEKNKIGNSSRDANNVKYSPDGKYLFVIQDSVLNMWDIRSGKLHRTLKGNNCGIQSFCFSPDKRTILSSSSDGSAKIWDLKSGKLIGNIMNKSGYSDFSGATFTPDGKSIMTHNSGGLKIWDPVSGELLTTISTVEGSKPCFSPDGMKILAVGDLYCRNGIWKKASEISFSFTEDQGGLWGPIAGLYEVQGGRLLCTFVDSAAIDTQNEYVGGNIPTYIIGFSPDGKNIITVSDKCRIWDAEKGTLLFTLKGQFDDFSKFFYTPDSKRILVINHFASGLYDAKTGKLLQEYDAPIFRIYNYNILEDTKYVIPSAGLSPDGKSFYIISGNYNSAKIWDAQTGEQKLDLKGNSSPVSTAVFSQDGEKILSKSFFNSSAARIWDLHNGRILQSYEGPEWRDASFCNEGRELHTYVPEGSGKTIINTWNIITGGKMNEVVLQADSVNRCIFSPDDRTVFAIDTNYDAKILNLKTGDVINELKGPVGDARYSPDGRMIATTSWFDFINIRNVENGALLHCLRDEQIPWNKDTVKYEIGIYDSLGNSVPVKIVVTPETPFDKIPGFARDLVKSNVKKVYFSLDGNTLIESGEGDFVSRIWDTRSGKLLNRFNGNKCTINHDGTRLLIFDYEENDIFPKIFDVQNGKLMYMLQRDSYYSGKATFSTDGKEILLTYPDSITLWDAQNGQFKRAIHFSGFTYDVNWKDEKIMIHDNSKLIFFDLATGKKIYTLIAIDSADYLVLTPDNYYMGTKSATSKLSWRIGNQLYSFDQFDLQYNRPDIVLERLGNPDTALIKMYRNAYEKRLKKSGFSENMFSSEWHTPEIEIVNSDSLIVTPEKNQVQLKILGTDSSYNLDRLLVWINGVPLYGANGLSLKGDRTDTIIKTINVRLSAGDNNIKVSCMNEKGVESYKESVDIFYDARIPVKPDLFIIAMSVSDYKDNHFNLQYAVKDGNDIAGMFDSLATSKGKYNSISVDTLFNARATRKNFFSLKNKLLTSNVDDEVIVFVSGHGLLNRDLDFYFATYDIDFRHPERNGISFDDLESILDGIPARKKLLMMDACHSGEVDKEEMGDMIASNTVSSPDITFRGSLREYGFKDADPKTVRRDISLNNSFELMQELFAGLDQGTGTTVISAAAGKGYALESPQWNNGVFTYSIINGLKNKAADRNRDGIITISELKDYSIRQVVLLTGGRQKPTARRESMNYDWKIW